MILEEKLSQLGLSKKEAQVYLACLQLGQDTVFNISKKSGVKRPTCYLVLESLKEKGLITSLKTPRATFYIAVNPQKLLQQIKQKETEIKTILPVLRSIYNSHPSKPKIELYEGIDGMSQIYQEVLDYLKKDKPIFCYCSLKHFYINQKFQKLLKKWLKTIKKRSSHVKEIINSNQYGKDYIKKANQTKNKHHKIKIISKQFLFTNDNLIYGDKIALFSTQKDFFAILIESDEIVRTYKNIFEILWEKL